MQKNRLYEGARRPRRAKLTFLRNADPRSFYVDASTREAAELQAMKEERRRLQRAGKVVKKKKSERAGAAAEGGAKGGTKAPAKK
jgi:hypothetical protein